MVGHVRMLVCVLALLTGSDLVVNSGANIKNVDVGPESFCSETARVHSIFSFLSAEPIKKSKKNDYDLSRVWRQSIGSPALRLRPEFFECKETKRGKKRVKMEKTETKIRRVKLKLVLISLCLFVN